MKISACYIAKDEAHELRRSLASLRDAADEIIVVSTAGDRGIAETAADFHAAVHDFVWQDDFSPRATRRSRMRQVIGLSLLMRTNIFRRDAGEPSPHC